MKIAKIDIKTLPVWMKMLPRIEDEDSLERLSRVLDITYSYVHMTTLTMLKMELITVKKKGRTNKYKLTEKGLELASSCNCIIGELLKKNQTH